MSNYSTVEIPPVSGEPPLPPEHPRGRRLWTLIATLVVLVIAVPLVLYALVGRHATPSTGGRPAPAPSAAVVPSTGPSLAPANGAATHPAPTGRISRAELLNGTFDIPAWPADAPWPETARMIHRVAFTNGRSAKASDGGWVAIGRSVDVDVDADGKLETLAVLSAGAQGFTNQVAVFTRDASGAIVPFGRVLATHLNGAWGVVKLIDDLRAAGAGTVAVRVGDDYPCCGTTRDTVQMQWRTYAWNGAGFTQVGGPTAFGVDTRFPDLGLTPTTLALGAPVDGVRHGVLTITVAVSGTAAANQMDLRIGLADAGLGPEGAGWTGFTSLGHSVWDGRRPAPALERPVTLQLGVVRPVGQDSLSGTVRVRLWPVDKTGNLTKDGWSRDNEMDVQVTNAGGRGAEGPPVPAVSGRGAEGR